MSISIKWFPPSWVLISTPRKHIYIDPAYLKTYFQGYPHKVEYSTWPDAIDGLPEALPTADFILVTHHHKDHCKRVTADRLRRPDTRVIAPRRCVNELGEDVTVIQPGRHVQKGNVRIDAVPAYNTVDGRSVHKQHAMGDGVGYLIHIEGKTIYHAGDTDLIPEMHRLGPVDVALLPIGGKFTMDVGEAIAATLAINPQVVIPIHRFQIDPRRFSDAIETQSSITAAPLKMGEVYRL